MSTFSSVPEIYHNASPSLLYQLALLHEKNTFISSTGALICSSGDRTGRCPKDKRIVKEPCSENNIGWGQVNICMSIESFNICKQEATNYLSTRPRLYISDVVAGRGEYQMKFRIVTTRAYHALFVQNMFRLSNFEQPDFTILNAGELSANTNVNGITSKTSISISFEQKTMVILGTLYAGEMKKGVFSIIHYYYPLEHNILTLHSSANIGKKGDVTVLFGLSGTGKTTLSTDPNRSLIGDDELAWSEDGVFNIESGCYAKVINLSAEQEPHIYNAIKFGTVLENVVYDKKTGVIDYGNKSITENTRAAYPMSFIPNSVVERSGGLPKNIILLTCDCFGVLPAVARLDRNQTMYYFLTGYTSIVAGTVMGITEPRPEFSACFGDAFLTLHPNFYAAMLADKIEKCSAQTWLVNTGWIGGGPGVGKRMSIGHTRAIIDAIHDGSLMDSEFCNFPLFNLNVPHGHPNIPSHILNPKTTWSSEKDYDQTLLHLAGLFKENFKQFEEKVSIDVGKAGPCIL